MNHPVPVHHSAPAALVKASTIPLHVKISARGEHSACAEMYLRKG